MEEEHNRNDLKVNYKNAKTKLDTRIRVPKFRSIFEKKRYKMSNVLNRKSSINYEDDTSLPKISSSNSQIKSILRSNSNLRYKLADSQNNSQIMASQSQKNLDNQEMPKNLSVNLDSTIDLRSNGTIDISPKVPRFFKNLQPNREKNLSVFK